LRAAQTAARASPDRGAVAVARGALRAPRRLPDTPERARQELPLQVTLGTQLRAAQGFAAVEVEQAFSRARLLCHEVSEVRELFPVLWGLWSYYAGRAESRITAELTEQLLAVATRADDPALLVPAHLALLEETCFKRGDFAAARAHLEQGLALYDPQWHGGYVSPCGYDLSVGLLAWGA